MKMIDLSNQRYGKLVVLKRDYSKTNGTYWFCKCDCGNIVSVRKDQLTRKKNPKKCCGCDIKRRNSESHVKDETGKQYGYLTVLYRTNDLRKGEARWHCICKCGNECDVSGAHLRNGTVQSCGCKRHESHNGIDETGKKYGLLTVLYRSNKTDGSHIFWHCKCDCGNECDVNGCYLRDGSCTNCGCRRSVGEDIIKKLLDNNNLQYIREYSFTDLIGEGGGRLRFDFAVFINEKLYCLIEYDGIQHFNKKCFNQTEEKFKRQQKHDERKNEYCKQKNIPLLRYNKDNIKNIDVSDILNISVGGGLE